MIGCACDIRRGVTTNGGMQTLKLICVLMAVAFSTPASAASREIENFCYEQLGRPRSHSGREARRKQSGR